MATHTSYGVQGKLREPPGTQDREKRDEAGVRVAAVVDGIREQDRAVLLVCNLFGESVQPFLDDDTYSREPRSIGIDRLYMVVCVVCMTDDRRCRGSHGSDVS